MKTPEEIKKAAACCFDAESCNTCPYIKERCVEITTSPTLIDDMIALIEQLEAQIPKWISVKDRLPEEPGEYLASTNEYVTVLEYCDDGEWRDIEGGRYFVDAWMQKPEPPGVWKLYPSEPEVKNG